VKRIGIVMVVHIVVGVALFGIPASQPDFNRDGQCEGIGFGCTLTPHDSAQLLVTVIGLPLVALSALVWCLVLARRAPRPDRDLAPVIDLPLP
jgi:hypothetical protein